MSNFVGVRIGRPDDAERVYEFLLELHKENALSKLSRERAFNAIKICLNPKRGIIGIIEHDGKIEACIGLKMEQVLWYADDWYLEELWNFVHPDHRKSNYAKKLIEFAKWTSSAILGVPLIMGIVTKKRLEPKIRLYQRQMSQIGAYFVYGKEFEDMFQQRKI